MEKASKKTSNSHQPNTIFIGNLSTDITPESLHHAFSVFGTINDIQIPQDPQKHTNRNFAFISYKSPDSALYAIDNMHLNVLPINPTMILKVNLARSSSKSTNDQFNNPSLINRRAIWDDENWIREHALKEPLESSTTREKTTNNEQTS